MPDLDQDRPFRAELSPVDRRFPGYFTTTRGLDDAAIDGEVGQVESDHPVVRLQTRLLERSKVPASIHSTGSRRIDTIARCADTSTGNALYFNACRPWERASVVVDNSDWSAPRVFLLDEPVQILQLIPERVHLQGYVSA